MNFYDISSIKKFGIEFKIFAIQEINDTGRLNYSIGYDISQRNKKQSERNCNL